MFLLSTWGFVKASLLRERENKALSARQWHVDLFSKDTYWLRYVTVNWPGPGQNVQKMESPERLLTRPFPGIPATLKAIRGVDESITERDTYFQQIGNLSLKRPDPTAVGSSNVNKITVSLPRSLLEYEIWKCLSMRLWFINWDETNLWKFKVRVKTMLWDAIAGCNLEGAGV